MIIGLSGYAQSGKDTCADYISSEYDFVKVSFATALRDCIWVLNPYVGGSGLRYQDALQTFGYESAKHKFPEIRRLLQCMGTEVGRNILGPEVWVNALMRNLTVGYDYVISDVRFPNEYNAIKKTGGVIVRVSRTGVMPVNDHDSETALDEYKFDADLYNMLSKEYLYRQIDELMFKKNIPKPTKKGSSNA